MVAICALLRFGSVQECDSRKAGSPPVALHRAKIRRSIQRKIIIMKMRHSLMAVAFGLVLAGGVSAATMSAMDAEGVLASTGYTNISVLEFHDGMWIGSATNVEGRVVDVSVNPVDRTVTRRTTVITRTGNSPVVARAPVRVVQAPVVVEEVIVIPQARAPIMVEKRVLVPVGGRLNRNDVAVVLAANGYHDVHDVEWLSSRNRWKAEARDSTGDDREIHVDPIDGRILHEEND